MVIAMIKNPPDTILDRSLVIKLRRKLPSEKIVKWHFGNDVTLEPLRRKLKRWVDDNVEALKESPYTRFDKSNISIPGNSNDRASDNWLPLFAIASLVSSEWLIKLEEAFKDLNGSNDTDNENISALLLTDIKNIFTENGLDKIHSSDLVTKLIEMEDRPWYEYRHGKPITVNTLARLLKPFEIKSKQMRDPQNKQGYLLENFEDAFSRYIPTLVPQDSLVC
jgi:hypothetical protein